MEWINHKSGGRVEFEGLEYELDVALKVESKILEFGRIDQVDIQGDHLVSLLRYTHTLVFFSQGENKHGHAKVDGRRVLHGGRLHGKIDIVPKGSEFNAAYVGGHLSATVLSIDPKLAALLPSGGDTLDLKPQTQLNDNFLRMMCEQFIHARDPLLQESLLLTLLVYMSRKSFVPQVSTGFNLGKKRKLIDYVEEHLEGYVSVSDLAGEVGLSVFHFLRLFKTTFGITPYQYILQRRIARAKILLTLTSDSIEIVSFKSGFNGGSQLSQTFSRMVGMTPSAFRKSTI